MASASFDFAPLLAASLPAPAAKWAGFPKYNFIGGNNDADQVPVDGLIAAATAVLKREGATLATYGLDSGPLGYRPLREFLADKLKRAAGITCTPDEILITSGSLQGLDLVNRLLLAPGDTVLIEQESYQGSLTRLDRLRVNAVGIPLDKEGIRVDALAAALDAPWHSREIHLHDSDGAEPNWHHPQRGAPSRAVAAVRGAPGADFRG